jgi:hypothetical protein
MGLIIVKFKVLPYTKNFSIHFNYIKFQRITKIKFAIQTIFYYVTTTHLTYNVKRLYSKKVQEILAIQFLVYLVIP